MSQFIAELEKHTSKVRHLDRTLFQHLIGTYKLLQSRGKAEYICRAGLYHSVYETEYFEFDSPFTRDQVKQLIGESAEAVVYEFCNVVPRTTKLLERDGDWSDEMYAALLDVDLANMVEQGYYNDTIKTMEAIRKYMVIKE